MRFFLKKRAIFSIIAGVVVLFVSYKTYTFFNGSPIERQELVKSVIELFENEGRMDDVESMATRYDSNAGDFDVVVKFKDEPNMNYIYLNGKNGPKSLEKQTDRELKQTYHGEFEYVDLD
ncbi:hypothetical protein GCM10008967_37640 [Bacillus carboniphilus]|uniref:DUF3139 domain-containing protein n=1 Tax=Bacillus carboniphilus TaxID=86663 RepID=A0ABP3GEQ5_9BACI